VASSFDELLERKQALQAITTSRPELARQLRELRAWQAARLARSYADLRANPNYSQAVEFFLSDIYAPHEFTQRDRDLTRAAMQLRRALPQALLAILCEALELEVLTLELDQAMALQLPAALTEPSYALAYRAVGRRSDRARQIELICEIGTALDAVVRRRWLGIALRAAHIPAHVAGFGTLQDFLERGWAAFRAIRGANRLLEDIRDRETAVMDALFKGRTNPFAPSTTAATGTKRQSS